VRSNRQNRTQSNISTLRQSVGLLDSSEKKKVLIVIFLQIFLGLLDLAGVIILGVVGSLAVGGVGLRKPGNKVSRLLELLNLENSNLSTQVIILGSIAVILLVGKTLISLVITKRVLYFLSRQGARLSSVVIRQYLSLPLIKIQSRSTQETVYAVTTGMNVVTVGVIGSSILLISDVSLLLILGASLYIIDPLVAISATSMFGLVGVILYFMLNKQASRLGQEQAEISVQSQEMIVQVVTAYREIFVKNRRSFFSDQISDFRLKLANSTAEMAYLQNISKFALEITLVVGTMFIAGIQFAFQSGAHAIAVLSIFLAASTRIAPAVMRIQQGLVQIKGNIGSSSQSLKLIRELQENYSQSVDSYFSDKKANFEYLDFVPEVRVENVSFSYPDSNVPTLQDISLRISPGSLVAIVGESGAGKTTLADVMLGIIQPDAGRVIVSGKAPMDAIGTWPGAIAYIPQDVVIFNGSLRENIALGFTETSSHNSKISRAVELSSLSKLVSSLPNGEDSKVGERGTNLSGGQRQRLGIARALFTNPKLLFMDEATSSLDGITESEITESISTLRGEVTIVVIAHRLSTVRSADQVIYLQNGSIQAIGTFDEVRSRVPEFDAQAKLMGL